MKQVFITGGTGYIGSRLIKQLLSRGQQVTVLIRAGSENKVIKGAKVITGNPFSAGSFQQYILPDTVFVQLLGVSHPSPKKAKEFREIDLLSVKASADAAAESGVSHFVYLSVAMSESSLMKAYQDVRKEGEAYCLAKKLNCTFIRPWYVLGPGHYWPILLLPFYGLAQLVPSWREKARSKELVTIQQMLHTLVTVIEAAPQPLRLVEIPAIKKPKELI